MGMIINDGHQSHPKDELNGYSGQPITPSSIIRDREKRLKTYQYVGGGINASFGILCFFIMYFLSFTGNYEIDFWVSLSGLLLVFAGFLFLFSSFFTFKGNTKFSLLFVSISSILIWFGVIINEYFLKPENFRLYVPWFINTFFIIIPGIIILYTIIGYWLEYKKS